MDIKGKIVKKVEWWSNCFFVQFYEGRPTFVSFKSVYFDHCVDQIRYQESKKYSNDTKASVTENGEFIISYAQVAPHKGVRKLFTEAGISCRWVDDCGVWSSTGYTGGWLFKTKKSYDKAMGIVNGLQSHRKYSGVALETEFSNMNYWPCAS